MLDKFLRENQEIKQDEIDKINELHEMYNYHRQRIACFFALSGAKDRLLENFRDLYGNWYSMEDKNTAFLATTSRKTADILYSQIWSNNNETIVFDNIDDDTYDTFIDLLNQTNMCSAIRGVLRDIVDIGVGFIYVEELSEEPYVHFKVLNPLNIFKHDGKYYHSWATDHDDDKNKVNRHITILDPKRAAQVLSHDPYGVPFLSKSNMKHENMISFTKDDTFVSLDGAGIQSIGTIKATKKSEDDLHHNASLIVRPPVVVNEQMITDDSQVNLFAGGVTKAAARYDTAAGTPIINALADYRQILPELIQLIQFNTSEIEKAYMLDLLLAGDPQLRMSAYQIVRNTMFNSMLPKMIRLAGEIFNKKRQIKLKPPIKIKFNSLSNSPAEAGAMANFTEFLNAVAALENITQGSGLKLHPNNTIDYLINILRLKKDMVFSEEELKQLYNQIAKQQQAQQQQQQAVQQQQALVRGTQQQQAQIGG